MGPCGWGGQRLPAAAGGEEGGAIQSLALLPLFPRTLGNWGISSCSSGVKCTSSEVLEVPGEGRKRQGHSMRWFNSGEGPRATGSTGGLELHGALKVVS